MTDALRIVSLNAWGGAVWSSLGPWIPEVAPDVLCLQEMIRAPEPSPDWLMYRDLYRRLDQRADLYGDVSALLPAFQGSFAPAARGPLQDADGRVYRSEHGLGMWVAPYLAVTDRSTAFIHGGFRPDGWGPEPVPRTMQIARIANGQTGRALVVAHLHGLRDPAGKDDTEARRAQADAVAGALERFAHPGEGIVLAGDFNLLPSSESFERLAGIGLRDLVTANGISDTRTALYEKPQRHANYMLVNDHVLVDHFDVPATPIVSDHRPLILTSRL